MQVDDSLKIRFLKRSICVLFSISSFDFFGTDQRKKKRKSIELRNKNDMATVFVEIKKKAKILRDVSPVTALSVIHESILSFVPDKITTACNVKRPVFTARYE